MNQEGRPTAAGMYEVLLGELGGNHYSPADEVAAEKVLATAPEARSAAQDNRRFVRRAVRYLTDRGIRQYIDMGSGFPTQGQVHEIAAAIDPHVVYIDHDPQVAEESRKLLPSEAPVVVVTADLRQPWSLIQHAEVNRVIDWQEPVALLFASVLHFVADDPREILAIWRERVATGSYLLISHASPGENPAGAEESAKEWQRSRTPIYPRSAGEIQDLFVGCEPVVCSELVATNEWGTNAPAPERQALILAGVGRYC